MLIRCWCFCLFVTRKIIQRFLIRTILHEILFGITLKSKFTFYDTYAINCSMLVDLFVLSLYSIGLLFSCSELVFVDLPPFKKPRNRFRRIDFARLGISLAFSIFICFFIFIFIFILIFILFFEMLRRKITSN